MQNVVVAASLLTIAIVGGAIGALVFRRFEPQPHLLVLDTRPLIESIASDATLDEAGRARRAQEIADAANQLIDQHSAHGAIVLDAKAVIWAPEAAYVRP